MTRNGKKKSTSKVAVEIKDKNIKFEGKILNSENTGLTENVNIISSSVNLNNSNNSNMLNNISEDIDNALYSSVNHNHTNITSESATKKLEMILSELENGCLAEVSGGEIIKNLNFTDEKKEINGNNLKKKMAALGFQAGIQLSSRGAFRDARKILEGFPGDDEYELTFEEVESDISDDREGNNSETDDESSNFEDSDLKFEINEQVLREGVLQNEEIDLDLLNGTGNADDLLLGLDPLRAISNRITSSVLTNLPNNHSVNSSNLNYPLIDPLKLQVIQSAESELTTVHDLFESTHISANQKLPLLKRKYMELMQQDIRHRLEALRVRDYLDTLHLERQVVERELEKAVNLRSSMEQLCEQLQAENSRVKAEKAGISSKLYGDLELKALEDGIEDSSISNNSNITKNGKKQINGSGGKKNSKKQSSPVINTNQNNTLKSIPTSLPETIKTISYEIPDANKLLEGAQGDLRVRFQLLINLYNQRELHFLSVLKAKDVEIQMLQGHYFSHVTQIQKQFNKNRELMGKINDLSSSESDLRAQLSVYVDKFKQVEDTLSKSNDLFATFRHEMEQMTSKLSRLEKENNSLQAKCATLSRNIIEMADERSKQMAGMELLKNQKVKLENLCRSMQAERNAAMQKSSSISSDKG